MGEVRYKFFRKFQEIFNHPARFKVIAKGRRVGFTRHCAIYLLELALENQGKEFKALWGDTTHENIVRYVERYFFPYLKQIPQNAIGWRYYKTEKKLTIGDAVIDFRSADKPENWEGFGYDLVILNEAGIILKNRYLWEHSVRPMLLDTPYSRAVIGGVPKGKNLFYELFQYAQSGEDERWKAWRLTTYDNPLLNREEIENLKKELKDEKIIKQEIYGEFVEAGTIYLFDYDDLERCSRLDFEPEGVEVWGVDVGLVHDRTVLVKRRGRAVYEVLEFDNLEKVTLVAQVVENEYRRAQIKPYRIFVDTIGIGWGVADILQDRGLPVVHANFSEQSIESSYLNKRAEAYFRLRDEVKRRGIRLPYEASLFSELSVLTYEVDKRTGKIKVADKSEIKNELGRSPDTADALALTFFEPLPVHEERDIRFTVSNLPRFRGIL